MQKNHNKRPSCRALLNLQVRRREEDMHKKTITRRREKVGGLFDALG